MRFWSPSPCSVYLLADDEFSYGATDPATILTNAFPATISRKAAMSNSKISKLAEQRQPVTATSGQRPAHWRAEIGGGFEGREALLGQAMNMVIKTLNQTRPYQHQVNGALVLAHLAAIQFAKNNNLLDKYVEHDRKTMEPINFRMAKLIRETGNAELALEATFDITECHYQLVLETRIEPGKRTWVSPYRESLAACVRIGQMDMTEEEIHENWTRPRLLAYANDMGVTFRVSDLGDDGTISCELG